MTALIVGGRTTAVIAAVVLEQRNTAPPFCVPVGRAFFIDLSMYPKSTGCHRLAEK
jgi:hypothetical protein